ncbi:hypothetical protein OBBRIDRAFT_796317 [Obba rivulosa]|uniref:Uncharacterized protein n=1 Tax=Obba rivulosa TaxID=1052685 RepID=A0A8E2DIZ0_9APHY|nr:hypothetical protein OBBRIDRAFT_796317 [Obba rivulosa]
MSKPSESTVSLTSQLASTASDSTTNLLPKQGNQGSSIVKPATATYPVPANHPPKNYEAAFGALSSSFGFGAGAPVKPKQKKENKAKGTASSAARSSSASTNTTQPLTKK